MAQTMGSNVLRSGRKLPTQNNVPSSHQLLQEEFAVLVWDTAVERSNNLVVC